MPSCCVVVPNHVPHLDFLNEWHELREIPLIVVQDGPEPPVIPEGFNITVHTWDDITNDLGGNAWIIPRQTSAVRSYGYYKAWQDGYDAILTLDNDCYPDGSEWVQGHLNNLNSKATLDWVSSAGTLLTRGFPYEIRGKSDVWLSHGLWSGVPDLDAPTSLHNPDLRFSPATSTTTVPRHNFFPMCAMNLAWRRELTPAMYFGLFGPQYGFDQYDDIWAGVLAKKVLDTFGKAAVTGYPSVEHRKQSNVYVNLTKQAPGMAMNEKLWQHIGAQEPIKWTVTDCYRQLIESLPDTFDGEPVGWTVKFKEAALIWLSLFDE